ncbi:enoyl-CoA hydratase/carnithine racemase [Pullulanibacillus pueri]|uniref:Putative enoyl-CoA hydratase/isomerase YngF n=1 Tax=Pullulanibacillus pueri TaxID=1437324 RepID=A0A8J2ZTP1_9BACL|nr:enoyl-CoA hydratase [Pullulanibacillus pueri]MBM7681291.1 enoyl-CoA hydratase/carnithine racemase [Pullulanibacillus pueri]GGH77719.1 putative enoyl-CoA hydratase/isomerase YngF [Pullulanibacillus pueri]
MNTVSFEIKEDMIGLLTLNRPEAANAFSTELLSDLNNVIDQVEHLTDLRVLILTGSGNKAFCAGADLKERASMNEKETVQAVRRIKQTLSRIEALPLPTLAAINGAAFGGGLELALACDLRYATEHAKMGLTETSLGIIPGAGGTQRLSRLIGIGKAKALIFTAKRLTSTEAQTMGLLEGVFTHQEFFPRILAVAQAISKNGPIAIRQAKKAIALGFDTDLHTGLQIEELCYLATIPTQDRLEGLAAFKEKRHPHYQGK